MVSATRLIQRPRIVKRLKRPLSQLLKRRAVLSIPKSRRYCSTTCCKYLTSNISAVTPSGVCLISHLRCSVISWRHGIPLRGTRWTVRPAEVWRLNLTKSRTNRFYRTRGKPYEHQKGGHKGRRTTSAGRSFHLECAAGPWGLVEGKGYAFI